LWKVLLSPSIREDGFAGQTNLGWQLLSFRVLLLEFELGNLPLF
jgi:hypothetical protein